MMNIRKLRKAIDDKTCLVFASTEMGRRGVCVGFIISFGGGGYASVLEIIGALVSTALRHDAQCMQTSGCE